MGDHFVLLVDRLITESTLEAAIESRNQADNGSADPKAVNSAGDGEDDGKLLECRICQEEDDESNMETPCSCCGSLKYAHRKCVQRWCNEKGDTICEICLQQLKPDYIAPPKLFRYGRIPMNFRYPLCSLVFAVWTWKYGCIVFDLRGNWEISRRDTQNHRFTTMVQNSREFVGSTHHDDHTSSSARSIICCRIVALIFMVLLILRHVLPIIATGAEQYSLALLILLLVRTAGVVLPIYVMLRAVTTFHCRRLQQGSNDDSTPTAEGENAGPQSLQPSQTA